MGLLRNSMGHQQTFADDGYDVNILCINYTLFVKSSVSYHFQFILRLQ